MSPSAESAAATEAKLDAALEDSFPASDPPSQTDPMRDVRTEEDPLTDETVSRRAYQIWQEAGSPDGRHEEHWAQARSELQAAATGAAARQDEPLTPTQAEEVR